MPTWLTSSVAVCGKSWEYMQQYNETPKLGANVLRILHAHLHQGSTLMSLGWDIRGKRLWLCTSMSLSV